MQIGGEPLDLGSWESNDSTATPGLWGFQVRREPHRSRTRVSNENKEADDGDDYAESWISTVLGCTLSMEWPQTQQTIQLR